MGQKYASLHAGLLARKGEAMPASRPGLVPGLIERAAPAVETAAPQHQAEPKRPTVRPRPPVREPVANPQPIENLPARHKTTIRLNAAQKRRLRLAAAVLDRSQQSLISEALDEFLDILAADPALDCRCLSRCANETGKAPKPR
ncbi:hypothetical protein [Maricaulis sp.]|uniref:hypothetical protein n=1 Tax=Maricaulis sp. TaxID=1486257 RepID=UPI002639A882|nr:hypothetical protein [Maricaulis sp.]